MKLHFHGGFGEKGRTSLGLSTAGASVLFDIGVNTSAARYGPDYYPVLTDEDVARYAAVFVSHAHEDHIGALGWLLARGFSGRVLMTRETAADAGLMLDAYAEAAHRALPAGRIELFAPGDTLRVGDVSIATGRTGHAVGGVWFHAAAHGRAVLYCDDMVPHSPALAYDPPPPADVVVLDASYGGDTTPPKERGAAIAAWVAAHPGPKLLPTPLAAKPLELMLAVPGPIAFEASMAEGLRAQLSQASWLRAEAAALLEARFAGAGWYRSGDRLPDAALFAHDGMGFAGPSVALLARAEREGLPVLLTGHLPAGTPAARMRAAGTADWLRLPTHPVLPENVEIARAAGAAAVLGHSCDNEGLDALARALPGRWRRAATGETLTLDAPNDPKGH